MESARGAIVAGTFEQLRSATSEVWGTREAV
jgi:hypothetical protein